MHPVCHARARATTDNPVCSIPGLVVLARRGQHVYHKAFGHADMESGRRMELDAQFRIFSMTKVLASATALALIDSGADLAEDRPVR
jgi:CubicO group peptidase (beta-lactamase class C family)